MGKINTFLIPSPSMIAKNMVELVVTGRLWKKLSVSLLRVLVGFVPGAVFGLFLGFLMVGSVKHDWRGGECGSEIIGDWVCVSDSESTAVDPHCSSGRIEQTIEVNLPAQRNRSSRDFLEIRRRILQVFFGDNEEMFNVISRLNYYN